ncbi:hypothetical protein A2U01_0096533, partial [Trifolium medium]|nr:hypothetical protein [Trifolium medium]
MPHLSRGPSRHRRHPAMVAAAGDDVPHTPDPIYHEGVSDALWERSSSPVILNCSHQWWRKL